MTILHIPHSSADVLGKHFLCCLDIELARMTDVDTDKLFEHQEAARIIFPISRLICDVERFEDDNLESMAVKGMGVCYTTNSFGQPLREFDEDERSHIIEQYYRPHHKALTEAVQCELDATGRALIIDCHSFSNTPLPHEDSQTIPRPDICIGTDAFHTPPHIVQEAEQYFKSCGYSVKINDPFAGTIIPVEYYQSDDRVHGIMIEVNRGLYKHDITVVKDNIYHWLTSLMEQ